MQILQPFRELKRQAVDLKIKWSPRLYSFALDVGLIPGCRDYTRFIILSRSRSGSNFLRGLLNAHSQVVTFSEMFKDPNNIGWGIPGYQNTSRSLNMFRKDPQIFVEELVFKKFPRKIKAVGFKIFYYHALGTELEPIWEYLKEHKEIHVLHLKRKNILRTHLSKKKAQTTNSWINLNGEREKDKPVEIDYEELLSDFIQTYAWEAEADRIFQHHPKIEIVYELLANDYAGEIAKIQSFLGLDYEKVSPQTYKQAGNPLSVSIHNYEYLKERFNHSPWEVFFTD
jgi:LPS sulfotransferase NodH